MNPIKFRLLKLLTSIFWIEIWWIFSDVSPLPQWKKFIRVQVWLVENSHSPQHWGKKWLISWHSVARAFYHQLCGPLRCPPTDIRTGRSSATLAQPFSTGSLFGHLITPRVTWGMPVDNSQNGTIWLPNVRIARTYFTALENADDIAGYLSPFRLTQLVRGRWLSWFYENLRGDTSPST